MRKQSKQLFAGKYILRSLAVFAGLTIDRRYKELPDEVHPLAAFGNLMNFTEKKIYRTTKTSGLLYLSAGVAASLTLSSGMKKIFFLTKTSSEKKGVSPQDFVLLALGVYFATGGAMLWSIAETTAGFLKNGDLHSARKELSKLVGRDTAGLDVVGVTRAVIESVAENTVDAVIAPIFYAFSGGIAPVLVHRAVNTMDAMVGYKNDAYSEFGFFSAKCDDVLNYLPARLAALAVMGIFPGKTGAVYLAIKNQAGAHPSPNGGVIETAFAEALGIQLGGVNVYDSIP